MSQSPTVTAIGGQTASRGCVALVMLTVVHAQCGAIREAEDISLTPHHPLWLRMRWQFLRAKAQFTKKNIELKFSFFKFF